MEIAILNENGICENTIVAESVEYAESLTGAKCVELQPPYGIGDIYEDSVWKHPESESEGNIAPEDELSLTPTQERERAYRTLEIIDWQGEKLTVDEANDLWVKYSAEQSEIAQTLSTLITQAKTEIRAMYPDTNSL